METRNDAEARGGIANTLHSEFMKRIYWKYRERMLAAGLWPQGWIARGACYSLGLAVVLFVLEVALKMFSPKWGDSLSGWVKFLLFDAALLFSIVAFRSLRRKVLWRLRNRLIVTYIFIGVIPAVLLVVMALISIYLFAGQFASFVVTSEINSQLRSMQAVNAAVSNELAARLEKGGALSVESLAGLKKRDRAWGRRHMAAWRDGHPLPLENAETAAIAMPEFFLKETGSDPNDVREGKSFKGIVRENGELYLRVAWMFNVGADKLIVVTSEPLDKNLVGKIADNLGEITLYAAGFPIEKKPAKPSHEQTQQAATSAVSSSAKPQADKNGIVIRENNAGGAQGDEQILHPTFSVGSVSTPTDVADREITFGTPLSVVDWKSGENATAGALVKVRTRPSILYTHLFAALGDIATGVEYILLAILVFFAVIEIVALIIGTRMTQTVTGAVAQLYDRYSSVVYAVALRVLGDTGAAEDVLQEVFLQLWRNPAAFDAARVTLGSWLAVIARNRAIDFLRKRKPETDLEDVIVSVSPDLAREADRSRAAEKIRGVIGAMPPPQRSALEMAYFEGLSHSEIAGKTGEPLGTIKTRIRTGLMTLRKAFQSP